MKPISSFILVICLLSFSQPAQAQAQLVNPFLPQVQTVSQALPPAAALQTQPTEIIRSYRLSFATAQDLQESLKELFPQLTLDKITNSLILKANEAGHARLRTLLPELDTATQQVTLEAKIIAISREDSKNIGVDWNWDNIPQRDNNAAEADSSDTGSNYGGNFKFWHGYAFRFNATLSALIANGRARILATPRIITIPGRQASIFIGDHIPVQTEKHDSSGSYMSTEYLDAGIKLQYTPIISEDGSMVTASVHTEVSTPVLISELKNYRITSRTADTNVRMFSGETLIIGGLISEEEQRTLKRVPLLSQIPLLGELFTNRSKKSNTTEVMLLLTPHITKAGTSPAIYDTTKLGLDSKKK